MHVVLAYVIYDTVFFIGMALSSLRSYISFQASGSRARAPGHEGMRSRDFPLALAFSR